MSEPLGMGGLWLTGVLGFGAGAVLAWVVGRALWGRRQAEREGDMKAQLAVLEERVRNLSQEEVRAAERMRTAEEERLRLLDEAGDRLTDAFRTLSTDALRENNRAFLDLASHLFSRQKEEEQGISDLRERALTRLLLPLQDSLLRVDTKMAELEEKRIHAYASLSEQVRGLASAEANLHKETATLARALRAPQVRGRWGELHLRRTVELAGMVNRCDFVEQADLPGEEGRLRPDLVIHLPGGRRVVVDAKTPLQAYLDSLEAPTEEEGRACLQHHARQVRSHLQQLASKGYWSRLQPTPEFVILFLPGEAFFSAALEADPSLLEMGVEQKVILATPTTLIALLRAVSYGWSQEQMTENIREISRLGAELHDRMRTFSSSMEGLRRGLSGAMDSYNRAVGSLENRVLPLARRLRERGGKRGEEIAPLEPLEAVLREAGPGNVSSGDNEGETGVG